MQRNSLLYALVASILFICFLSVLDNRKANASLGAVDTEDSWLLAQWVVAEAYDMEREENITSQFSSEVWQFLGSNGFVQFKDRIIENTGEWGIIGERISIKTDGDKNKEFYTLKIVGKREVVLEGTGKKIRLLKLGNL